MEKLFPTFPGKLFHLFVADKKLNKAEIITGRYYLRIPEGCSSYKAVLGDITEKEIPAENGTIVITKETTPAKIHTFTDNEKSVFVARFA